MKLTIIAFYICICTLFPLAGLACAQTDAVPDAPQKEPAPVPEISRELWSGSLYTSTYRAGVCIDEDGTVRGVLLVRTMNGTIDPYHFYGTFEKGELRAAHGSGHSFKGSFPSDKEVTGKVTLKSGREITLTGKRQRDVTLTETCRPLPE